MTTVQFLSSTSTRDRQQRLKKNYFPFYFEFRQFLSYFAESALIKTKIEFSSYIRKFLV